jgi:phosphomannomutase
MLGRMPRISAFYGIVIAMYFDDHGPPHFHARYGSSRLRS